MANKAINIGKLMMKLTLHVSIESTIFNVLNVSNIKTFNVER